MDSRYRIFFESMTIPNNVGKIVREDIDVLNFFDNVVQINNKENFENILADGYLFNEEICPDEVNYNQPILDLILNSYFGEQLTHQQLLNKLNKRWVYYSSFQNSDVAKHTPLYVFKFDFDNTDQVLKMFKYLNFDDVCDKNKSQHLVNQFLNTVRGNDGLFSYFDQIAVMCLNEKTCNKQTVAHELTHYFQQVVGVIKSSVRIDNDLAGVPELQLTKNDVQYLFNQDEFVAHTLIDVLKDFDKFYYCVFKGLCSRKQFIDGLIFNVEKSKNQIFYTQIGNLYSQLFNKNTKSLQIVACSCFLNIQWDFVKEQLLKHFSC